ncbi:MAG: V-type ATP synthase subunit E [Trueperaceae bacterium]
MADLAALLDREASAEIEGILSEARARASEIVAAANEEASTLLAGRRRSAEAQQRAALVRARSAAQLESSSLTLRAQHAVIEEVFGEAEREIDALTGKNEYADVLAKLIDEAVAGSGVETANVKAVVVNPGDQAAATKAAKAAGLSAAVETDESVRGGLRLKAGENVIIENTLYGRLESLREELAAEVAQVLLSKEG